MAASAEMFRAREVYRYYQPRSLVDHSNPSSPSHNQQHNPNSFNALQSFSDTALTAFAQLIAIRLASQRAIVSLIDHENEYFLAESTSTLSHLADSPTQNAWLSISGARVPLHASLSEQTLRLVPNQKTIVEMTPVFFVPDLRLDESMSKLDCVKGPPYLRFYCGVPLTNKKNVNIGCVYVVDDKPRTDFSLEQAQFLTTMAATIMDHLENIRAKEDVARVTKMSQALHAFIEGDGTMEGDWERLKRYNLPSGAGVGFHWESNNADGKPIEISRSHSRTTSLPSSEATSPGQSPLQHTTSNQDARYNFNNSPWSSSSEVPLVPQLNSVLAGTGDAAARLTGGRDAEFSTDGFSNLLHGTFSRASNLVREGMEVDGAVFFDAPFKFYQGRSALQPDTRRSDTQYTESTESPNDSSDEDHLITRPGPSPQVSRGSYRRSKTRSDYSGTEGLHSDILGFSTQDSSSWNDQETKPHPAFQSIPQSLLTSLVRRYPKGQLFVFDENGPTLPPPGSPSRASEITVTITTAITEEKHVRRQARRTRELQRLLAAFPGSRQIFFVPLYDSTSGCFIGSFAWSTSATRIFSIENHLSYLVAFGHSVMSEVSRLNTLSADHAKGDFISNVSHELRSPLHGILASVEFLADTTLDGFQRNLVETVDICGRTLLDTIEHVLDFSKIKKFGQDSMQSMGVVADLDISAVIEEVLEGVFAGFEFNGLSSLGLADMTKSHAQGPKNGNGKVLPTPGPQPSNLNDSLNIILDMDFRDQWKFPTVPGTWRRLTMNIFGNALKYTRSGYIKIKLEARRIAPSVDSGSESNAKDRTMVTMKISDSGQGMSSEFMKTKLFTPFSQEDVTAPGTGLGMSLVKQIVDLAGGTIDVRSEIGRGTEITLSLPLESCSSDLSDIPESLQGPASPVEDPVMAVRRRSRGRVVTILGFENLPGSSSLQVESLSSLKVSIEKYIAEWFNLEISSDNTAADILICDESAFLHSSVTQLKFKTLLILCSNSARRDIYTAQLDTYQSIEFVSKPCGPHRLAKALLNCFDSEDAMGVQEGQRVSEKGSRHNTLSHGPRIDVATKIADAGQSARLIGNLQSQIIGFSPTTNLPRSDSASDNSTEAPLTRKPTVIRKGSTAQKYSHKREILPSDSATTSNATSELSSTPATPNSSTSEIEESEDAEPAARKHSPLRVPKMLLVEDNPINMMLLETYMKKNNWELEKAANGLLAMQAFQNRLEGFDVIFMDISMPVMNGYESTRLIRSIEAERRIAYDHQQRVQSPWLSPPEPSFPFHIQPSSKSSSPSSYPSIDLHLSMPQLQLNKPALIIALTGFSSENDQELAFECGVDVFMTKPVRFREVGRILDGWLKSRERESLGLSPLEPKGSVANFVAAE